MNYVLLTAAMILFAPSIQTKSQQKSMELVKQLGAASFRERENACRDLVLLGMNGKNALEIGAKSHDGEVRARSKILLEQIQKNHIQHLLRQFLTDSMCSLPGWKTFSKKFGSDNLTRNVYAKMAEVGEWRFMNYESDPLDAARLMKDLYLQIVEHTEGRDRIVKTEGSGKIVQSCIIFYLSQIDSVQKQTSNLGNTYNYMIYHKPLCKLHVHVLDSFLREKLESCVFRKIFIRWLESSIVNATGQYGKLAREIDESLPAIWQFKLIEAKDTLKNVLAKYKFDKDPDLKGYLLHAIASISDKNDLQYFSSYLNDATVICETSCHMNRHWYFYETQIRDIALAATIHLSGEDLSEIGFGAWWFDHSKALQNDIRAFSFVDEESRQKVFQNWKNLKEKKTKRRLE